MDCDPVFVGIVSALRRVGEANGVSLVGVVPNSRIDRLIDVDSLLVVELGVELERQFAVTDLFVQSWVDGQESAVEPRFTISSLVAHVRVVLESAEKGLPIGS